MARNEIKISDRGYRALMENVAAQRGQTLIRAGIFEGPPRRPEAHEKGETAPLTNAEVGAIQEFGLGNVHERSFIRGTVDQEKSEIHTRLRRVGGGLFFKEKGAIKHEAMLFGEWFVGRMKTRIRDGIEPENDDETIKRKGSSTPLIDSGQLWSSLTYDVQQGGGR